MSRLRLFATFLAAWAILIRAAVPSGWMPVSGNETGTMFAPCEAAAPMKMAHEGDHHGQRRHDKENKSSGNCEFAPLQAASDLLSHPGLVAAASDTQPACPGIAIRLDPGRGPAVLPPPSTGPPIFA